LWTFFGANIVIASSELAESDVSIEHLSSCTGLIIRANSLTSSPQMHTSMSFKGTTAKMELKYRRSESACAI